jgi:hypothetical protein
MYCTVFIGGSFAYITPNHVAIINAQLPMSVVRDTGPSPKEQVFVKRNAHIITPYAAPKAKAIGLAPLSDEARYQIPRTTAHTTLSAALNKNKSPEFDASFLFEKLRKRQLLNTDRHIEIAIKTYFMLPIL